VALVLQRRKLLRTLLIAIVGLILNNLVGGSQAVHAYLLPAEQILEFVTNQTAGVYNFRLDVMAESPDPELPETFVRREMVYYAARPDLLRREIVGEVEASTVLVGSGQRISVAEGHLLREPAYHEDIFPIFLHADSRQTLEMLLTAEQVNLSQVHLGRLGKQIAYVIGGSPRESETPQFWCDKNTFWPIRLIGYRFSFDTADLIDIRYLEYVEVAKSIWLPKVIEFYRRDKLILRLIVQRAHVNEPLPDSLFDFETFVAEHPPLPQPQEPTEKPTEPLEEMRRYLEKKFE